MMIAKLLISVSELAQIWLKAKATEKQSLSDAKARRASAAAESEQAWSDFMRQSSANSWKDEAWTLCFVAIVLACFIPPLHPYIIDGFAALETTPDWFRWAMMASIGASFGLRGFDRFVKPGRRS